MWGCFQQALVGGGYHTMDCLMHCVGNNGRNFIRCAPFAGQLSGHWLNLYSVFVNAQDYTWTVA